MAKEGNRSSPATRVAVYPGSFDPVTRGHLDIVERALALFDRLTVGVLDNTAKSPLFSVDERVDLLRSELDGRDGVEVVPFRGLAVDLAASSGAHWLVRGVRSAADAAYELPMACSNRLCGQDPVETVFFAASPEVSFIESRLVREIAAAAGDLDPFVTPRVAQALRAKV